MTAESVYARYRTPLCQAPTDPNRAVARDKHASAAAGTALKSALMVIKLRRVAEAPVKSRGASLNLRREARSPCIVCLLFCSFDAGFDSSSRGLPAAFLATIEGADGLAEVISEPLHDLGRSWCRYSLCFIVLIVSLLVVTTSDRGIHFCILRKR
jgi:hypothetical protein